MKASLVLAQIMEAPLSLRTTSRPFLELAPIHVACGEPPSPGKGLPLLVTVYGWHSIILSSLRFPEANLRNWKTLAHGSGGPNPASGSFLNCWVVLGKARPSLGNRDENVFSFASWVGILENPSLFG